MSVELASGAASAIGSLPHTDPRAAAELACRAHPLLPAAPELPHHDPRDLMIARAAAGIRGVTVGDDGTLRVDPGALDPAAPVDTSAPAGAGTLAFLDAVASRRAPIKLQLTGPVTLGLALVHEGVPGPLAFDVASAAVRARAGALTALAAARAPDAPLVVFLDEPGLTAAGHPGFPLDPEPVTDLLSGALAAIEPAVTGVHCCGATDWRLPIHAGAQIVSLPLGPAVIEDASTLAAFLERGGWIAWGVVPTTGPIGTDTDLLWRRLTGIWCDLTRAGCDPLLLRRHSLVTPVCGLANHGRSQAELVLRLTSDVAERVQDQALATRLSVGA